MAFDCITGLVLGIFSGLLGNLVIGSEWPEQFSLNPTQGQVQQPAAAGNSLAPTEFNVPSFVSHVPEGHFAGVSPPMHSLAEARKAALDDVVRQVLGAIGAQYEHRYVDTVTGSVFGRGPGRKVHDQLSGVANGVVLGVERNIVESSWCREISGKWVCFVLVKYPDKLIGKMRRLSRGAKIVASFISDNDGVARVKVRELNGVGVTITEAGVTIRRRNRFAGVISLFLWRVPRKSEHKCSIPLGPLLLCGNTAELQLPTPKHKKSIKDYFLGSKLERAAVLKGHNEIGRPVTVSVSF